ncbi:MAG: 1-(5-phosphoribosyl)-5-[(5-phosphoribosylamino)methylideneamino]imidazole-4-carboxamide isomerase [Phycisphaeraceae bacterium]|nr:1-(5-phosphoribosyl)-5-[(5-phosphoribosylamino)methylideneamino]imidazole-4-carboxamide isomerase [Phycisphaeraceae bacterium]
MNLLPAIDLMDGQIVRLYQGDYDRQTTYGDDPVDQARRFEDAGARWLHVVDLAGARNGRSEHLGVIERICAQTGLQVELGGGIRDRETIRRCLEAGAARLVLGTAALGQWDLFQQWVHEPALEKKLVLGLDARHGKLAVSGWETETETDIEQVAEQVSGWPLAAIVYTDIETDGTLAGPNLEATERIARTTDVPVVASGGVGKIEHLLALRRLPIEGAIVGRALYDGAFTIEEALEAFEA